VEEPSFMYNESLSSSEGPSSIDGFLLESLFFFNEFFDKGGRRFRRQIPMSFLPLREKIGSRSPRERWVLLPFFKKTRSLF